MSILRLKPVLVLILFGNGVRVRLCREDLQLCRVDTIADMTMSAKRVGKRKRGLGQLGSSRRLTLLYEEDILLPSLDVLTNQLDSRVGIRLLRGSASGQRRTA